MKVTEFGFKLCFTLVAFVVFAAPPLLADDSKPPEYEIGKIPQLSVWHGDVLRFALVPPKNFDQTSFSFKANPKQVGTMVVDERGVFAFAPSEKDKFEFNVTFTATSAAKDPVSQTVTIVPMNHLASEYDIIDGPAGLPPQDEDLVYSETVSATMEDFNHQKRLTRTVHVSGKLVVIDDAADINHLYQKLNHPDKPANATEEEKADRTEQKKYVNEDIRELSIYAENVEIHSPLWLPQTKVTIYARTLKFVDRPNSLPASLTTTPVDYNKPAAAATGEMTKGDDGGPGAKGGNVALHISQILSVGPAKRLLLTGGRGQNPGPGHKGGAGKSMVGIQSQGVDPSTVYLVGISRDGSQHVLGGQKAWPEDGKPGIPAGKPGLGGAGGDLDSSVPEAKLLADQDQGPHGSRGEDAVGGDPGLPNPAYWVHWDAHGSPVNVTRAEHTSRPGPTTRAPVSDDQKLVCITKDHSTDGSNVGQVPPEYEECTIDDTRLNPKIGAFTLLQHPETDWLHPLALQADIAYLKRAYILRNFPYVTKQSGDYLTLLELRKVDEPETDIDLEQARSELQALYVRVTSNLDYFGKPPGWVPYQSLDAWMKAYDNEVDSAIPLFYLTSYLKRLAVDNKTDLRVMQTAQTALGAETQQAIEAFDTASRLVGELQVDAMRIADQIEVTQKEIKGREADLMARATFDADKKIKLRDDAYLMGALCKVIPVGQPYFGALGDAYKMLGDLQSSNLTEHLGDLSDIANSFTQENLNKSEQSFRDAVDKVTPTKSATAGDYAKQLAKAAKDLAPSIKLLIARMQATRVAKDEVEAEIQRLKATDVGYADLIGKVSDLLAQKEIFANKLAEALQTYTQAPARIERNLIAIDAMGIQINNKVDRIDERTLWYLNAVQQSEKDRLLKYLYLMSKAYEYRMLERYPGNLDLNRFVSKIESLIPTGTQSDSQAFDSLKGIYKQELSDVIDRGLDDLKRETRPEWSVELKFGLHPEQIAALNHGESEIALDLSKEVESERGEENRRIANIGIAEEHGKYEIGVDFGDKPQETARIRFLVTHPGESVISSRGHIYRFEHSSTEEVPLFTWGASHDVDGTTNPEKFSAAGLSLLSRFLRVPIVADPTSSAKDTRELYPFALPGSDTIVKINAFPQPKGVYARLSALRLAVTVSFIRNDASVQLHVETEQGQMPYITCDQQDKNGRSDGRGAFTRFFASRSSVTLEAEPFYAGLKFSGWYGPDGSLISRDTKKRITIKDNTTLRVAYSPRGNRPSHK